MTQKEVKKFAVKTLGNSLKAKRKMMIHVMKKVKAGIRVQVERRVFTNHQGEKTTMVLAVLHGTIVTIVTDVDHFHVKEEEVGALDPVAIEVEIEVVTEVQIEI